MILRRVIFERYGCFGSTEFDFRRGLNLISGANETGKSQLLSALPVALLGVEHGPRLRSWGDTLNCRITLLFEGGDGAVRLSRDIESNLVRIEQGCADGTWRELFSGKVPPAAENQKVAEYLGHLERMFSVGDASLLRLLADPPHAESLITADLFPSRELLAANARTVAAVPLPVPERESSSQLQDVADLEAELEADREDYRKGTEYLAWIRKRWENEAKKTAPAVRQAAGKTAAKNDAALERRRDELQAKLQQIGLPPRLPADLPALFETAEGLRQELADLQLELTPLQRRKPTINVPGFLWPLLLTVTAVAVPGAAYWMNQPWWLPLSAGCGAILLLSWILFLVRLSRARAERDLLDQQIQAVEIRRADALSRQGQLAEQFEFYGLSSTPVEMVKLQQLWRRHEDLIAQYQDVCARLGGEVRPASATGEGHSGDRHLKPEELPEAEARLAELAESIRRREARLAVLRGEKNRPDATEASSTAVHRPQWTERQLLSAIGHFLERLTAGRHREVRLEEGQLRLEAAPGRWAPATACSKGTSEALALAVRLACFQMTGTRLPLAVDGMPAHLDARRQQAVFRELERFALEHQLLLASCDDELAKRAARERWPLTRLNVSSNESSASREEKDDAGQLHLL